MARILLAGASIEALAMCRRLGHQVVAVSDPARAGEAQWQGLPCHASDAQAIAREDVDGVVVAIDAPAARRKAHHALAGLGACILDAVDGRKGDDVVSGRGLFVQTLANLSEGSRVGEGTRLNIGANVMHDAWLGDFVTIAPGAILLGRVSVGDGSYIGAGAVVLPEITIGRDVMVGAGAVVTRPVPDGSVVKGVPAR